MRLNYQSSLKRTILIKIVVLISLFIPKETMGLEIYSFVTNGCDSETGLVVNTDEEHVYMLNIDGILAKVKRVNIELILVYNIHDNPINSLDLRNGVGAFLREVRVDDTEKTNFIGWPIKFYEDLIIFFDIQGKLHLVDIEKILFFPIQKK